MFSPVYRKTGTRLSIIFKNKTQPLGFLGASETKKHFVTKRHQFVRFEDFFNFLKYLTSGSKLTEIQGGWF